MQDIAYGLPRKPLLGTWVNKGKREGRDTASPARVVLPISAAKRRLVQPGSFALPQMSRPAACSSFPPSRTGVHNWGHSTNQRTSIRAGTDWMNRGQR